MGAEKRGTLSGLRCRRREALGWAVGACIGAWSSALAQPAPAPVTAASLTLALPYHRGVDVTAYWVSEKYDGVRALWDGQVLRTRQGLAIAVPDWFTAGWPAQPLDGELWLGRGRFLAMQTLLAQGRPDDPKWRQVRYMVFDLPAHPGPFDVRWPQLQHLLHTLNLPWVRAVPQWHVASHEALMTQLQQFTAAGAEGLMLRRGDAPYRAGRQQDLLKLTLWEDDEARVIAHLPGRGKYQGLTGALLVEDRDGRRFRLGSGLSDADRRQPPPIGSTVTYRFRGRHPSGLPRFARYWRVRQTP